MCNIKCFCSGLKECHGGTGQNLHVVPAVRNLTSAPQQLEGAHTLLSHTAEGDAEVSRTEDGNVKAPYMQNFSAQTKQREDSDTPNILDSYITVTTSS